MNFEKSRSSAVLLNLLLPGLGHIYWKEYIFGIFIFLINLIAVILFFVSFFIELSLWFKILMAMLPLMFYLFTFIDLARTVKIKQKIVKRTRNAIIIFLIVGLVFQLAAPIAPVNFYLRNFPEYFIADNNNLSPLYVKGELLKTSKLSYLVNIFFVKKPILHTLPKRYDVVRFINQKKQTRVGIVIGLPNQEVEIIDGVVIINGFPDFTQPSTGIIITGDCPLTYVNGYSILVATLNLGMIDTVYQTSFNDLLGRVEKVF